MTTGSARDSKPRRNWKEWLGFGALFVAVGVLLTIGGAAGLAATNTESFCISCHKNDAYAEFKDTIHDTNRTGVRATCADCHVPHAFGPKMVRKVEAAKEVWGHITGVIDTKQKYDAHRSAMAQSEWRRMLKNESATCRSCHVAEKMNAEAQSETARARHTQAKAEGLT